jgi:hypothetical protein
MNMTISASRSNYDTVNKSFEDTLIYHLGVDAGFFTEYMYMLNAMMYCLHHRLQFRLYSADANFGVERGWTDYFAPFCPEDQEELHSIYNRHALPTWRQLIHRNPGRSPLGLLGWKMKVEAQSLVGHLKARQYYHRRIRLNQDVHFRFDEAYPVAELGMDSNYLTNFKKMANLTWHFNAEVEEAARLIISELQLPEDYLGCQLRGGDKSTEVDLTSPDALAEALRRLPHHDHVFVLTDDYRLYEALVARHPDIHWYTLCTPQEQGYVNKVFTATSPLLKRRQMVRFLTSVRILMNARHFVGSICPGPSLFLLKYLWPNATPLDCARQDFPRAITLPVRERGEMAGKFLSEEKRP